MTPLQLSQDGVGVLEVVEVESVVVDSVVVVVVVQGSSSNPCS